MSNYTQNFRLGESVEADLTGGGLLSLELYFKLLYETTDSAYHSVKVMLSDTPYGEMNRNV